MGAKLCACGRKTTYQSLPEEGEKAVELTQAEPEPENSESGKSDDGGFDKIFGPAFCCCCVLVYLALVIPSVILSQGFTECPDPGVPLNGTDEIYLPNRHVMEKPRWQFTAMWGGLEMNVYNPLVSNTSRIGYWRTAKTASLRTQFAYVPEGSDAPQVVVTTPFFSWTTTYNVFLCPTNEEWMVKQELWIWQSWGQTKHEYSIYDMPGEKKIAKAQHVKDIKWIGNTFNPPGWKVLVTSEVESGKEIGVLVQDVHHWMADGFPDAESTWTAIDQQPELLSPTVLSFMAASYDLNPKDEDSE